VQEYFLRLFFDAVDAFIAKGNYFVINFYSAFIKSCLLKTNFTTLLNIIARISKYHRGCINILKDKS